MGLGVVVFRGRVFFLGMLGFWVVDGLGRVRGLEVVVLISLGVGVFVFKTVIVVGGEGIVGVVVRVVVVVVSGRGRSFRMSVVFIIEVVVVEGGVAGMLGVAVVIVAGIVAVVGVFVVVVVVVVVGVEMVVVFWLGFFGIFVIIGGLVAGFGVGRLEVSFLKGVFIGWMFMVGSTAGVVDIVRVVFGLNRMVVFMFDFCSKFEGVGERRELGSWVIVEGMRILGK